MILSLIPIELKPCSPYVKKTWTEPPLAQLTKGASPTLNHTTLSLPFPRNKSRRYTNLIFFIPVTPSRIISSGVSKSPQIRFLIIWSSLNYFTVHPPSATNSIHLQSIHILQSQHLQSEAYWGSVRTSVVELCFRRRAPSWMFDRILNATLPNNLL